MIISRIKRLTQLAALLCAGRAGALSIPAHAIERDDGIRAIFTSTDSFPADNEASRWHYLSVLNFKMKLKRAT